MKEMVYNLSFLNYVGGQDGRVVDEMKHLNKSKEVRNLTGEWITTDLKEDIMATKHQTEEMQRMTADLKKDIMATKNQTEEMQRMTRDLKKEIMATNANQTQEMQWMIADLIKEMKVTNVNRTEERTAFHHILQHWVTKLEMWAMKVNQTVEGRVKLILKRKELKLLPN